jgi:hypothetical protein
MSLEERRLPFGMSDCKSQMANSKSDDEPKIAVVEIRRSREIESDRWWFGWRIQNLTEQPVGLLAAWCPHGQFKSDKRDFDPDLQAASGQAVTVEMHVSCDAPAGAVIENAFLILLTEWGGRKWRIFVRLRVTIDQEGIPGTTAELITNQRVGFSGID